MCDVSRFRLTLRRPELMLQQAHRNGIVILVIVKERFALNPFLLKSQLLINMERAGIVIEDVQFDAVHIQNAEAVIQHQS
ncbi:hypothetical protein D1872_197590 [compost metagenome]